MTETNSLGPTGDIVENLEKARQSADRGDVSHTVLYAQEAVCLSIEALVREMAALRLELSVRRHRELNAAALAG
jgi:HEPN domain-containing protein